MAESLLQLLHPREPEPPTPEQAEEQKKAAPPPLTGRLMVGLGGALLAGMISYLDTRIGQEALADIRGGLQYGSDEGSWIATAFAVGELAIVPLTPWLASALTPRVLIPVALFLSVVAGAAIPEAPGFPAVMALRFIQGVGDGMLIPLLLMTVLRTLQGPKRVWGVALYGLVVNLPPVLSEGIAGVITDHFIWKGLFYYQILMGAVAIACVIIGLPREAIKWKAFRDGDYFAMLTVTLSLGFLTVALGQGQRLDWFDSGIVSGLFAGAIFFFVVFLVNERLSSQPLVDLDILKRRNFSLGLLLMMVFNFGQLSSVSILPAFSMRITGFREAQIGEVLIWLAFPEIILPFVAAWLLRRLDSRLVLAGGFFVCLLGNALSTYVTSDWQVSEFIPWQLLQACGWPFIMVALAFSTTSTLTPKDTVSGSVMFNSVRTLAGTAGGAIITAIVTVRERVHSSQILGHFDPGAARVAGLAGAPGASAVSATARLQAYVLSFADAYGAIAIMMLVGIVIVFFQKETRVPQPKAAG